MNVLIINTLTDSYEEVNQIIEKFKMHNIEHCVVDANDSIKTCEGCYHCLFVDPGKCKLQDGFEEILKLFIKYDSVIFICNTVFDIFDSNGKKILERFLPIVTIISTYVDGEIRNTPRYNKKYHFGAIYMGDADDKFLNHWFKRASSQLGADALGAYHFSKSEELLKCIL